MQPQLNTEALLRGRICAFWTNSGSCLKGNNCDFAHIGPGTITVNQRSEKKKEENDANSGANRKPKPQGPIHFRTKICKWNNEQCKFYNQDGNKCHYLHLPPGYELSGHVAMLAAEIEKQIAAQLAAQTTAAQLAAAAKQSSQANSQKGVAKLLSILSGGQPGSPSATVCRFWLKGTCQFGEKCRNLHTQQSGDAGQTPAMEPAQFGDKKQTATPISGLRPLPLHMLAESPNYLPSPDQDPWSSRSHQSSFQGSNGSHSARSSTDFSSSHSTRSGSTVSSSNPSTRNSLDYNVSGASSLLSPNGNGLNSSSFKSILNSPTQRNILESKLMSLTIQEDDKPDAAPILVQCQCGESLELGSICTQCILDKAIIPEAIDN
jgi:hypothetical protein